MKALNARGVPPMPRPRPRDEPTLRAAVRDGALVVDTRPPAEFLARASGGSDQHSARTLLSDVGGIRARSGARDRSPRLTGRAPSRAPRRFTISHSSASIACSAPCRRPTWARSRRVTSRAFLSCPRRASAPRSDATIIDVRSEAEWNEGHIPGARHFPLTQLAARADELRDAQPIVVHCQGGARSSIAVSVLRASGIHDVTQRGRRLRRVGAHARAGRGRGAGPLTLGRRAAAPAPRARSAPVGRNLHLLRALSRPSCAASRSCS